MPRLTVGELRRLIKHMPDSTPIVPTWADGPPGDHEPGVELVRIEPTISLRSLKRRTSRKGQLHICVRLFYLNQEETPTPKE